MSQRARKIVLLPWIAVALLVGGAGAKKSPSKIYRVAVLAPEGPDYPQLKGLRAGMEEAGYIEGENLVLNFVVSRDLRAIRASVQNYVKQGVDAIVAVSEDEAAIAREATREIPIIFMPASEPVMSGFVKSLAEPAANLTGLTSYTGLEDVGKQLEVFKEVVPTLRRIVVLYDGRKESRTGTVGLAVVRKVAAYLALKPAEKPVRSRREAEQAVSSLPGEPGLGVFVICGPLFWEIQKIATIAIQKKLPLFGCSGSQVAEEKVLLTYAADLYYIGYRAAWYLDRILKGASPRQLPVETPSKFDLVINLATAKEIGHVIPPQVLILADKVIH